MHGTGTYAYDSAADHIIQLRIRLQDLADSVRIRGSGKIIRILPYPDQQYW